MRPSQPPSPKSQGSLPPSTPAPVCPVSGDLRAVEAEWVTVLAGGRASFLDPFSNFIRVCVLLRKAKRRRLSEDGIKVFPPSHVPVMRLASSMGMWRCLQRICLCWICSDLFVVHLRSCVFKLDHFDLHSSCAAIAVLVRWFYEALT